MEQESRHKWKVLIKRTRKTAMVREKGLISAEMWGLFALEPIPAGAFVVEYVGEILTAKEGDSRGRSYDQLGMSYLFDMNDPDESDEYEQQVQ
jgi:SET domain-containing protein